MTTLERRLSKMSWKLLNIDVIKGAHAGSIYRIDVLDQDSVLYVGVVQRKGNRKSSKSPLRNPFQNNLYDSSYL